MRHITDYVVLRPSQLLALVVVCILIGLGFGFFGAVVFDVR